MKVWSVMKGIRPRGGSTPLRRPERRTNPRDYIFYKDIPINDRSGKEWSIYVYLNSPTVIN
ncbi:hypothetical protein, partial [Lysinibacillus sp. D4A3_S15]|uniref:hypothetical protein n=1 Tax=Lysinibacillus sp. D4A3_S15 TaxID=2941227 RepID=UPI0020C014AB